MIRMVLFALGFIAITVTLVIVQPGAKGRLPEATAADPVVTRAEPAMTAAPVAAPAPATPAPVPQAIVGLPAEGAEPTVDIARVVSPKPQAVRPAPTAAPLDDQEMRRMTWETLSSLNHATGRESAPGQPGSLLHTIVRRSLDGSPAPRSETSTGQGLYVVQDGDSLVSIAERIYGDVNMTGPLFAANTSILSRPDDLRAGQTLVLPGK